MCSTSVEVLPQLPRASPQRSRPREGPMSALRSGIDELAGLDLAFQSHEQIQDDVVEISRAMDRLGYELARRVDEARRRGEYAADGFLSATRWPASSARPDTAPPRRL